LMTRVFKFVPLLLGTLCKKALTKAHSLPSMVVVHFAGFMSSGSFSPSFIELLLIRSVYDFGVPQLIRLLFAYGRRTSIHNSDAAGW
jgi:hypothetical protein